MHGMRPPRSATPEPVDPESVSPSGPQRALKQAGLILLCLAWIALVPYFEALRGLRIVKYALRDGHFAEHPHLRAEVAHAMVEQGVVGRFADTRRTAYHHHRRALGIGAGNRIDEIEGAGAIGRNRNAEATMDARRRIRREAHGRLVAQLEMRQDLRILDHLVERQHEIAGDAEDLSCAMSLQGTQQDGCERSHVIACRLWDWASRRQR